MHTNFSHEQLQDPTIARADAMLKRCVHCGFCTATCPTYVLLGDERDSPRGRIYLIKEMFEQGAVTPPTSHHIDRCLSCLSCMTTCPSGVDYMHLVDLARVRIEQKGRSPGNGPRAGFSQGAAEPRSLPHRAAFLAGSHVRSAALIARSA